MARYRGSVCRLCRREGMKLFLKGARCTTDKCAFARRGYNPGQHGRSRVKLSDYGVQLREKQKLKRLYGVLERQFRFYFKKATKQTGKTGEALLQMLERRLDNVVFRLCFASTRSQARQLVRNGHILVNGKKVDIPSYQVRENDNIQLRGKEKLIKQTKDTIELVKERGVPAWLEADFANQNGKIAKLPQREDVKFPIQEQLIVELYSK